MHVDGMNGADAAGVNGKGVSADGARGVGTRGANVDVCMVDGARGKVNGASGVV